MNDGGSSDSGSSDSGSSDSGSSDADVNQASAFLDAAPDPIVIADEDGNIHLFNKRAEEVFGYESAEVIGQSVDLLLPERLRDVHIHHRSAFAAAPHARSMGAEDSRVIAVTSTGREFAVEVSLSPISVDGHPRVMAAIRDITDRIAAEERLRRSEKSFRAAFDDAPVAMAMVSLQDGDRRIIQANEPLRALVGASVGGLLDTRLESLIDERDVPRIAALLGANPTGPVEVRLRRNVGQPAWVWAHWADLSDGESRRVLVHMVDITRRVEAELARDQREAFLVALGNVRAEILTERASERVLELITGHCAELWPGCDASVATTNSDGAIEVRASVISSIHDLTDRSDTGDTLDTEGTALGAALRTRTTVGTDSVAGETSITTIIAPFTGIARVEGALMVSMPAESSRGAPSMLEALAAEASMAIEVEEAARERRRQLVTTDRERIARDLHDLVIQRLFAAGMRLQSAVGSPDELDTRAREVVHELDETISEIRNTIFKLTEPDTSLREQFRALIDTFITPINTTLSTSVTGDLATVPEDVAAHLLATVNEAVSNALRHGRASKIAVAVTVGDDLELTVEDNGVGLGGLSGAGRGLANMAERAAAAGGVLSIESPTTGGTQLTWTAPMTRL